MKNKFLLILLALIFSITYQSIAQETTKLPSAQDIFKKYSDSIGGKENYYKLTSRIYKGTIEIPAMNITGTFEMLFKAPNMNLVSLNLGGFGNNLNGFDGTIGWAKDEIQGLRTKSDAELEQVKLTSDFYYPVILEKVYPKAEVTGIEKLEDLEVYVVKVNENNTLYFDKQTGFLVKTTRFVNSAQGKQPVSVVFSDYREIEGIKYPFYWKQNIHGGDMIFKFVEVKQNQIIEDQIFSKPK